MTTLDRQQLEALLEHVNAATGPDRKLDATIRDVLKPHGAWLQYTSSVDAALELVTELIPGKYWYICAGRARVGEPLYGAQIVDRDESGIAFDEPMGIDEHDHSAALALVAALLRALISQQTDEEAA